jgi:hypothetical protein
VSIHKVKVTLDTLIGWSTDEDLLLKWAKPKWFSIHDWLRYSLNGLG